MSLSQMEFEYSQNTIYVVSLSSGISSAIAAERVINHYGKHMVRLVFMDTLWEDDDNYRFLNDLETRWQMDIVRLTEGRTPLQVGKDEHIIPNQKIGVCTHRLKIEIFVAYIEKLKSQYSNVVVVLGMNWTEPKRCVAPTKNYGERGFKVEYPLFWKPLVFDPMQYVRDLGVEPPRMYQMGYSHANCGGRCVKQGISDWTRTYYQFPERFKECEDWETEMRKDPRFANYAFLRDQSGGTVKPLPLSELIKRIEIKEQPSLLDLLSGDRFGAEWSLASDQTKCFCNAGDPGPMCKTTP